ncbi:BIR1 Protein BIR1 [Candida maltosa Xu316]
MATIVKDMIYEDHRFNSFKEPVVIDSKEFSWSEFFPDSNDDEEVAKLVDSGFFYNPTKTLKKRVTCAYCDKGSTIRNKKDIVDLPSKHLSRQKACPMEFRHNKTKIRNFWINHELFQDPFSESSIEFRKTFFVNYPLDKIESVPNSLSLAKAGFIFTPKSLDSDRVTCMYCKCSLDFWDVDDVPIEEHKCHVSGYCYVIDLYGKDLQNGDKIEDDSSIEEVVQQDENESSESSIDEGPPEKSAVRSSDLFLEIRPQSRRTYRSTKKTKEYNEKQRKATVDNTREDETTMQDTDSDNTNSEEESSDAEIDSSDDEDDESYNEVDETSESYIKKEATEKRRPNPQKSTASKVKDPAPDLSKPKKILIRRKEQSATPIPKIIDDSDENLEYDEKHVEKLESKIVKVTIERESKLAGHKRNPSSTSVSPIKLLDSFKDSQKKRRKVSKPNILDMSFESAQTFNNENIFASTKQKRDTEPIESQEKKTTMSPKTLNTFKTDKEEVEAQSTPSPTILSVRNSVIDEIAVEQSVHSPVPNSARSSIHSSAESDVVFGGPEIDEPINIDTPRNLREFASPHKMQRSSMPNTDDFQGTSTSNSTRNIIEKDISSDKDNNKSVSPNLQPVDLQNTPANNPNGQQLYLDTLEIGTIDKDEDEESSRVDQNASPVRVTSEETTKEIKKPILSEISYDDGQSSKDEEITTPSRVTTSAFPDNNYPNSFKKTNVKNTSSSPSPTTELDFKPTPEVPEMDPETSPVFKRFSPTAGPLTSPIAMNSSLTEIHRMKDEPSHHDSQVKNKKWEKWEPRPLNQFIDQMNFLQSSAKELKELAQSEFDLHDDINGALTGFIAEMPEEEEEMTIRQWMEHCATNCRDIVDRSCTELSNFILEEYDRAIKAIEDMPTID